MRHLLLFIVLSLCCSVSAFQIKDEKSYALLEDINSDISQTLSRVLELETDVGEHGWAVYLSSPDEELIRAGVIVEPKNQQVLSVSAEGVAHNLGLLPGDVIKRVQINDKSVDGNFSELHFNENDELNVFVNRQGEDLQLKLTVSKAFTPRWELYSKSSGNFQDNVTYIRDSDELSSSTSLIYLNQLQERINFRLSKIYQIETNLDNSDLKISVTKKAQTLVELGLLIDEESREVLSVVSGSNADRMGFEIGDIIQGIAVNGELFEQQLSSLQLKTGDELKFNIVRKGSALVLSSTIDSREVPSWHFSIKNEQDNNSCGYVTFLINPSEVSEIYRVDATKLNGETVSPYKVNYELEPGTHKFKLYDHIPVNKITPIVSKRRPFSRKSKTLVLKVEANKRYFLGAQYNRTDRYKIHKGLYWEPIVTKVENAECSLE
ncbi:hypothetical protein [Kangiella sediminilitoris]|uniref:PDZ domain-containing protein n=1 Tax=Kangiella sediminilitoris TaxID=1144748 RepID=A0A1B3BB16_9GAMM|nr:hypothetical protein [Kangiella sediminilitoris]AOE49977.1 hypothetical protein KS2013_1260 [Kangiella sediminilitoris]